MANWIEVCKAIEIPIMGAKVVETSNGDIAIFKTSDEQLFALRDSCPHKQGPLSQGIVHGHKVTCPLHNWNIDLKSGEADAPDEGCTGVYQVKEEGGLVYLAI